MTVQADDGHIYRVKFLHEPYATPNRTTRCLIEDVGGKLLVRGVAFCRPGDQFSRAKGRQLSLARALARLFPGSYGACIRAEFWFAYHSRQGSKIDAASAALKFAHRAIRHSKPLGFMSAGSQSPKLVGRAV